MNPTGGSPAWARTAQEVLAEHQVAANRGLSTTEAQARIKRFGLNIIGVETKISRMSVLLAQFKSPVVIILLVATAISFGLGETVDAVAILTIVTINSLIGFFQEIKAEAAVEALKKMSAPKGRVLRDGQIHEVPAAQIVPGDILFLESGDFVAADARLLEVRQVSADEAVLTGESIPVTKSTAPVGVETLVADRRNMLFAGTAVATGTAKAVVSSTGAATEIGKIASLLEETKKTATPLQLRLEQVSQRLLWACGAVVVLVALLGYFHGEGWLEIAMTAISLSVAAIPEGLPTVVTLALALAIRRMTKKNAIVKHLPAVETLGSTSVICTDKTGTLTTGKMSVREVFTLAQGTLSVDQDLQSAAEVITSSVLCSNAAANSEGGLSGDPTEVALLILAQQTGVDLGGLLQTHPRVFEWSFESDRKRMSVACKQGTEILLHCKGAPEAILSICQLSDEDRQEITRNVQTLSGQGRRLLAVAKKILPNSIAELGGQPPSWREVEKDLNFLGLASIADPPRPESIKAVHDCRAAGIKVVMITGDHPVTAKAIASELGIVEETFNGVLAGPELEKLPDSELAQQVERIAVYARVSPEHKLRIVRAWQSLGHIVAMTGDGVNDAPALKQASIGISMGRGGTEVARQASSMILTDDNFATIVAAVEEGRAIYGNIRRTIQYLLSGNLSEILIMLGAAIMGWPAPLAPIHLLWINLVTDGLPSLALAAEPVPKGFLKSTARPSPENFFSRHFYNEMVFVGITISVMSLIIYGFGLKYEDEATARTHVFTFLVFAELFRSFACRSETQTVLQLGLFSNLYHVAAVVIPMMFQISLHHFAAFQGIFKVTYIGWLECLVFLLLTLVPVSVLEIRKFIRSG
ncbi:MAG: cation-translocating P-type ATPase [Bdellovibrionales bacterium]|nr:cation-translocating P-type ATPase [Bdellovibrionales bacterium]